MSLIIENEKQKQKVDKLFKKGLPSYREAFSDRMCFLMACLSELVYFKFNKAKFSNTHKEILISKVNELLDKDKTSSIEKLFELVAYDHEEIKKELIEELDSINMKVLDYFDEDGTQAILCSADTFYALAFRGTEPTSIKDIKTDLDAKKTNCETGGNIHRGFKEAFRIIQKKIQDSMDLNLKDKPLIITGHSLGGALATIATKKLNYEKIAACYTFGSPRVGDEDWMFDIKPPIYRIVNSADPVTMLPPSTDHIDFLTFVFKFVPYIGEPISKFFENYGGYSHTGYMRFLTNIENGNFQDAKLLYSVSFLRRIRAYAFKWASFKKIPADHSIKVYRKKLQHIAFTRQNIT